MPHFRVWSSPAGEIPPTSKNTKREGCATARITRVA